METAEFTTSDAVVLIDPSSAIKVTVNEKGARHYSACGMLPCGWEGPFILWQTGLFPTELAAWNGALEMLNTRNSENFIY